MREHPEVMGSRAWRYEYRQEIAMGSIRACLGVLAFVAAYTALVNALEAAGHYMESGPDEESRNPYILEPAKRPFAYWKAQVP
jgi:hypothetical protein